MPGPKLSEKRATAARSASLQQASALQIEKGTPRELVKGSKGRSRGCLDTPHQTDCYCYIRLLSYTTIRTPSRMNPSTSEHVPVQCVLTADKEIPAATETAADLVSPADVIHGCTSMASITPLKELEGRGVCPSCEQSQKYFCYNCLKARFAPWSSVSG